MLRSLVGSEMCIRDRLGSGDVPDGRAGTGDWTEAQDEQLRCALRRFPADIAPADRWEAISSAVDDKDAKQCAGRLRLIRKEMALNSAREERNESRVQSENPLRENGTLNTNTAAVMVEI
eukprot:TRINITY_DN40046_c0_g1_i1.p2 TRINITY_DN40046_c0_g1~~TRINITY_DN40046_c0_g1_i1.p2  ORF type:complete len:120 (-),score=25.54 TRINITY_DN40046_c0_g1_i1:144-503(-)